jgi:hypothetical protein
MPIGWTGQTKTAGYLTRLKGFQLPLLSRWPYRASSMVPPRARRAAAVPPACRTPSDQPFVEVAGVAGLNAVGHGPLPSSMIRLESRLPPGRAESSLGRPVPAGRKQVESFSWRKITGHFLAAVPGGTRASARPRPSAADRASGSGSMSPSRFSRKFLAPPVFVGGWCDALHRPVLGCAGTCCAATVRSAGEMHCEGGGTHGRSQWLGSRGRVAKVVEIGGAGSKAWWCGSGGEVKVGG